MMRFQPVCKICNQVRWCGDLLQTSLCALHFNLQAKGIITGNLLRLATYGILMCIHCPCLQLMNLWFSRHEWSLLLLITKTGKVSKLVTSFTLKFLCRALKAFHMSWISTLWVSFLVLVYTLSVKDLLVMTWHLGILITRFFCDLVVLAWQTTSSSCVFLMQVLCTGPSLDWFVQLVGNQPPVWCGMQLPWNFLSSLQAVWPCLLEIF